MIMMNNHDDKNFWRMGRLPYRWYNPTNDNIRKWYGTDSPENFALNPNRSDWDNIEIEYKFNTQAFRTYDLNEFLGQPVDVALGCSHTEGVGLPVSMTWPYLVEQQRDQPILNLGVGAGSTDTVARILTNIAGSYQIKSVFILWPQKSRFELYDNCKISNILPHNAEHMHLWNMDEQMAEQRYQKNKIIVDMLSQIHKFSVAEFEIEDIFTPNSVITKDTARDGMHPGPKSNIDLANILLGKLTQ